MTTATKSDFPMVTIIVVNLDGENHLKDCLGSLLELNYPKDKTEIMVVDNASGDKSVEIIKNDFPQVKLIENERNFGFAEGNNIGAKQAEGDWLAFLNNDTRADKEWLIELVKAVQKDKEVICAGSKILNFDGSAIDFVGGELNFYGQGFQKDFESNDIDSYNESHPLLFACGGAMLIKKDIFLEVGGFDKDYFAFFEDVDLGWRLWVLGYKVMFVPTSIIYHKHHGTADRIGSEKRQVLYERNALYTLIKNYDDKSLQAVLPAALLLAIKRGFIFSGLNKQGYRIKSEIQAIDNARSTQKLGSKVKEKLKEKGPFYVAKRSITTLATILKTKLLELKLRLSPHLTDEVDIISKFGASHFIALDDLIENLPNIFAKRQYIQDNRKRSDQEILELFKNPFRSNCTEEAFLKAQEDFTQIFNIKDLFRSDDS